jgi:hypothetical protein
MEDRIAYKCARSRRSPRRAENFQKKLARPTFDFSTIQKALFGTTEQFHHLLTSSGLQLLCQRVFLFIVRVSIEKDEETRRKEKRKVDERRSVERIGDERSV